MSTCEQPPVDADRDLVLSRLIAAPRQILYRCWTEPELLKRWFAPQPWTTPHAELDVRVGGTSMVVMRGPDGSEFSHRGVYLAVEPGRRLVSTDAFQSAWEPSAKAFMVADLSFDDEAGGTRYVACVRHWTAADRRQHEEMGFHAGWGQCTDQLEALARTL